MNEPKDQSPEPKAGAQREPSGALSASEAEQAMLQLSALAPGAPLPEALAHQLTDAGVLRNGVLDVGLLADMAGDLLDDTERQFLRELTPQQHRVLELPEQLYPSLQLDGDTDAQLWVTASGVWVVREGQVAHKLAAADSHRLARAIVEQINPDEKAVAVNRALLQAFALVGQLQALLPAMGTATAVAVSDICRQLAEQAAVALGVPIEGADKFAALLGGPSVPVGEG